MLFNKLDCGFLKVLLGQIAQKYFWESSGYFFGVSYICLEFEIPFWVWDTSNRVCDTFSEIELLMIGVWDTFLGETEACFGEKDTCLELDDRGILLVCRGIPSSCREILLLCRSMLFVLLQGTCCMSRDTFVFCRMLFVCCGTLWLSAAGYFWSDSRCCTKN